MRFVAVVEVLQAVQVVQVPDDRGVLAVDLERVERLVAAGVAGRFEHGRASRSSKRQRNAQASSMPTFSTLPVRLCLRSLTNVSVIAVTLLIGAVEPEGRVDAVGQQVAGDAAAGRRRHRAATGPAPPCGRSAEIVQSCRNLAR